VIHIQTVDQVYLETTVSEITCKVKETERLGPEVIGCKIVDPGVNENQ
jgi:hypothetical protein